MTRRAKESQLDELEVKRVMGEVAALERRTAVRLTPDEYGEIVDRAFAKRDANGVPAVRREWFRFLGQKSA